MKLRSVILLLLFFLCLYILFFQTKWLGVVLSEKLQFPLGSLISWGMIIDFSFFAYSIFPSTLKTRWGRKSKNIMKIIILLSFLWGLFSWFLAGNWNWVFSDMNYFIIWAIVTVVLILVPITIMVTIIYRKTRGSDF